MAKNTLKVALLQHACSPRKEENVSLCLDLMKQAAKKGAQLIVTQELFASQYFCQTEDDALFAIAEPIPGPTTQKICDLAKKLKVHISASLFEKRAAGVYHNTSIMVDPSGTIIDRYRKMHIPDDPRFYEKYYFTPGDLGFRAQQLKKPDVTTGMLVCWDQWYPEAARLTALRGAQVLLYPTAIGWYVKDVPPGTPAGTAGETPETRAAQLEAWKTIQRSHAISNGVFVVAANRIGTEGELKFWGHSFVAEPSGKIIAEASETKQEILIAECDLAKVEDHRLGWPFLRDRRIDAYANITKRLIDED
jgi:N-carbamoylputrescine amidase